MVKLLNNLAVQIVVITIGILILIVIIVVAVEPNKSTPVSTPTMTAQQKFERNQAIAREERRRQTATGSSATPTGSPATPTPFPTFRPEPTPTPQPPITAVDLYKAREANATRFDARFKSKTIRVIGRVGRIDNGVVDLAVDAFLGSVALDDLSQSAQMSLNRGEIVTATCKVGNYILGTIFLRDCKLD